MVRVREKDCEIMTREEILSRYRHLRAISTRHHRAALDFLPRRAILDYAKCLGMVEGRKVLVVDSESQMPLVFDLAIYTAGPGGTRALDRYARAAQLPPGSDEALVLDALRRARFSVWRVERRHEVAGLIVFDMLRNAEAWLMDENLEKSAPEGMAIGGRLSQPEDFAMTCGAFAPVTPEVFEEVLRDRLALRRGTPAEIADDPRFATAIYRAAIASGIMEHVAFE
jgi:hypothetical protein